MNDIEASVIYKDRSVKDTLFRSFNEACAAFKTGCVRGPILGVVYNYRYYPVVDQDEFGVYFK